MANVRSWAGLDVHAAKVGAPLMERAMRRANRADLRRIKQLLERV